MDYSHIIHAEDLVHYSRARRSQEVIPELVNLLVTSSPDIVNCRIPYGNRVNSPGWDGIVEAKSRFRQFIPEGVSYWEITTAKNPEQKATEYFEKRTEELSDEILITASFVFVASRASGTDGWDISSQEKWKGAREKSDWKEIHIIDDIKLADWLREFPAIGKWLAKEINLMRSSTGILTPQEHWETITHRETNVDPPLPPRLFIEGRNNACDALQALFDGESQKALFFIESSNDIKDFVAAYIHTLDEEIASRYAYRCLFISEEDAWYSISHLRRSHILIADTRLGLDTEERADLQTVATQKGHAIVIPYCDTGLQGNHEILKLRSPSRFQIETVFREAGYTDVRSQRLAEIGDRRISVLRRYLQGLKVAPPYATWENVGLLAKISLIGKWDGGNLSDREVLEELVGKTYGEWIEILKPDISRADSPVIKIDDKWRFVARGEAWRTLGKLITDNDLNEFCKIAIKVLGERDPQFDLEKEKRFSASVYGKVLKHSNLLREGLVETLALIGSRPDNLSLCSRDRRESAATLVVRELLNNKPWDRWASLDPLLPLLAESAPNEFLATIESALMDLDRSPFNGSFAQEFSDTIGGRNYTSGLLWALETLAWHPDFLSRVAVILSNLSAIDPGGNWNNRPLNSLTEIFLPWFVQTCAPFERRQVAVRAVLHEQPEIGWKLILDLLPRSYGSTSGCRKPIWRDYIPDDWNNRASDIEYAEEIDFYTELAVNSAKTDAEKLEELIDKLADLPNAFDNILNYLISKGITDLPEIKRFPIWKKLHDVANRHQRHANAEWAMGDDKIAKIESVMDSLAPTRLDLKYRNLFDSESYNHLDGEGDYKEQEQRLNKARQDAIQEILDKDGTQAVCDFALSVAMSHEVGIALGSIGTDATEMVILPSMLNAVEQNKVEFIAGFIWSRFKRLGWPWADDILNGNWRNLHKGVFLTLLPFNESVWQRVEEYLSEENKRLYWTKVRVVPFQLGPNTSMVITKLVESGRFDKAVLCIYIAFTEKVELEEDLIVHVILNAREAPIEQIQRESNSIIKVIKHLQNSSTIDQDSLFQIEWGFLPLLNSRSQGSPVTLERWLASKPDFFAKIISLCFRAENEEAVELSKERKILADNAYRLLDEWKICPGSLSSDTFDTIAFEEWIDEVKRITEETGHWRIAQSYIGQILTYAPPDPDGLWIHKAVAQILDAKSMNEARIGFKVKVFNRRGVYSSSAGEQELKIAQTNSDKAEILERYGFIRFANALREIATRYEKQSRQEAITDELRDW